MLSVGALAAMVGVPVGSVRRRSGCLLRELTGAAPRQLALMMAGDVVFGPGGVWAEVVLPEAPAVKGKRRAVPARVLRLWAARSKRYGRWWRRLGTGR